MTGGCLRQKCTLAAGIGNLRLPRRIYRQSRTAAYSLPLTRIKDQYIKWQWLSLQGQLILPVYTMPRCLI